MIPDAMFQQSLLLLVGTVLLCVKPLGGCIADVMDGRPNVAVRLGGRMGTVVYRVSSVDSQ